MLQPRILKLSVLLISFASFLQAQESTKRLDYSNPSTDKTRYILLIDEAHQKQLSASGVSVSNKSFAVGNVAVIPANLRTLIPVNEFDLYAKKVSFIPSPTGGYTVQVSPGEVSDERYQIEPYESRFRFRISFSVLWQEVFFGLCR